MPNLTTSWHDRSQYGNIVKHMIKSQYKTFQKTQDAKLKLNLSKNLAYLIQTENSLINDRYNDMNYDQELLSMVEQITNDQKDRQKLVEKMQRQKDLKDREKYYDVNTKKLIAQQRKAGLIA